ncbi:MAG: ABC transporter substrate-binding protein [Deltaproteobacteria bacterium]|nr:ABC transporter substrate-binding protein [Deltaproteobacteria bacterium]
MDTGKKKAKEKGITRRDFIKTGAAVGAVAAMGSIGFPSVLRGASPPAIPLGHIHPLSGFLGFDGQELKKGLLLAVSEINDAGGIKSLGGAKLKLLDADSEGKPDLAVSAVERLRRAGAVAIMGCYQSSVTLVATQIAEKLQVPFVVTVAVADKVTARGFKYTFRIQPNAEQMASQTVNYISDIAKVAGERVRTIAYLHDNTAFGTSLSGHVKNYAPQYGMKVITDVPYSPRAADVSTEVGKIKAAGADIVMDTGYFGDGVRVLRTMRNMRVRTKGIIGCGNGAFSHPKFVKELGAMTEYVMDGNYRANPRSDLTKNAFAHYKQVYGTEMGPSTVFAYQAVYVVADALERAQSTDYEALRKALTKTHITKHILPQGPIVFGPDGQNKNARAAIMQVLGGKVLVVWPEQYAEAKWVFPQPA